jgi:hypothetical protein
VSAAGSGGRFSALLLEGLDHYRKGRMLEAVRAWEEAYLLEPTNLRAREFLRSALERIHAHMGPARNPANGGTPDTAQHAVAPPPAASGPHPWLPASSGAEMQTTPGSVEAAGGHGETQTFALPGPAAPRFDAMPAVSPPPLPEAKTQTHKAPPSFLGASANHGPLRAPSSPWDDGPSIAIPQPEDPGDEASGAWSIHKEALPIEAVADDETDVWMRGARELLGLNDFSGALELLGKILERKPGDKDAQQMHDVCEQNLTLMYESKIGSMDGRPATAIPPDEIIWLNLDPRAGFVLAQIDGEVSFDDLYAICGLKRLDTARILSQLLEEGVVQVQGQDRAVAKRALHRS